MSRRVAWVLVLAILLAPVLGTFGSSTPAFAEDEIPTEVTTDGTVGGTPTDEITPEPSSTAEATPTASETPTGTPTETATPSATATETPTEPAAASPTPTETETASPVVEPAGVVTTADITITALNCTAAVEGFRVTNNGTANVSLTGVETLADKLPGEPFAINRTLKPGQTGLFQAGPTAQYGTVITAQYIFTDSLYDQDGVVLHTSAGEVTQACPPKPKVDPWVANPGKLSDLKITLNCTAYTESIRVENKGTGYILIKGIATYYDPIAEEPFSLNRVLKPGQGALYQAGAGAKYGTVLTKRYIFTNSVWEKDGVRVATSAGKAFKACDPKPAPPERWVEVDLSMQYLWAWEGNKVVNQTYVSTGKAGWETPTGTFYILVKYRYEDMAGSANGETWYVPDVPWVMYFTNWGHALHGTYWHNDFGTPRSHGCVNLPLPFAEWLYYWLPYGGRVVVHW